jgi:hypothetical protein
MKNVFPKYKISVFSRGGKIDVYIVGESAERIFSIQWLLCSGQPRQVLRMTKKELCKQVFESMSQEDFDKMRVSIYRRILIKDRKSELEYGEKVYSYYPSESQLLMSVS